jgi:hypothetical protein
MQCSLQPIKPTVLSKRARLFVLHAHQRAMHLAIYLGFDWEKRKLKMTQPAIAQRQMSAFPLFDLSSLQLGNSTAIRLTAGNIRVDCAFMLR